MLETLNDKIASLSEEEKKKLKEKLLAQQKNSIPKTGGRNSNALSHAQQRLWMLQQLSSCDYLYHVPVIVALPESVHLQILAQAFHRLVQENPVLASYFIFNNDDVKQYQNLNVSLTIQQLTFEEDLPEVVEISRNSPLADFFLNEINPETAPLMRIAVLTTPGARYLLLCLHHIIIDGWSISLMFNRLSKHYEVLQNQQHTEVPAVAKDDYTAFIDWEKAQPEDMKRLDYWMHRLNEKSLVVDVCSDYPRTPSRSGNGKTIVTQIRGDLFQQLNNYAKSLGVSLNHLLLFAFQFLLARYSGQDEITIGIPVAGRPQPRWYHTLGLFVNTCLHSMTLEYDSTVNHQLNCLKRQFLDDMAYADQPFDKIVKQLYACKKFNQNGVFNILYNFIQHDQEEPAVVLDNTACKIHYCTLPISKFDLSLHAYAVPSQIDLFLEFSTDLYEERTAHQLLKFLLCVLEELPKQDQATLKQLSAVCMNQYEMGRSYES